MKKDAGILYGVGVGPGDPELLTLKAVRVLQTCDRLILPAETREKCRAYQIAVQALPALQEKPWTGFHFPMTKDREAMDRQLDAIYTEVRKMLAEQQTLAFLTIGDPLVYSTYCYMQDRAQAEHFAVSVVNGIPSFTACAGRFPMALAEAQEEIHIFPGPSRVEEALALPGTRVFMKSGKALGELLQVLKKTDRPIYAVADCGLPTEQIFHRAEEIPEDIYMLTVIVK